MSEEGDNKRARLGMILLVITRMGGNSFFIRGWPLTLVVAVFALAIDQNSWGLAASSTIPAIAFTILDGYYLRQERLLRKVYDQVRKTDPDQIDYDMNHIRFIGEHDVKPWQVAKSASNWLFYGPLLLAIIVVSITLYVYTASGGIIWLYGINVHT